MPNLRKLDLQDRVQTIRYCGDTYKVTTADGETREFWETWAEEKSARAPEPALSLPGYVARDGMFDDCADPCRQRPGS